MANSKAKILKKLLKKQKGKIPPMPLPSMPPTAPMSPMPNPMMGAQPPQQQPF